MQSVPDLPPHVTPVTKRCTKCGEERPLADFLKHARTKDGLQWKCKSCRTAYNLAYRAANRECLAAYRASYRAANREHLMAVSAAWQKANPERFAAYQAAYRAAHLKEKAAHQRNYHARKKGNGGEHTVADVQAQYTRQKGTCFYCGKELGKKYHVDHVMPLAKGGSNGPENLVVACPTCNLSKGDKHPMDFGGMLL